MTASHGSGDPGPCPAVPPNPVETAPTGGWPAPAASSRLTISRPLAPSRTTIVCTVPAPILKRAVAVEPEPMACMVHVFAGMAWYELTEAKVALGTMACPPQVNLTVCCFSDAWITRTSDLPD